MLEPSSASINKIHSPVFYVVFAAAVKAQLLLDAIYFSLTKLMVSHDLLRSMVANQIPFDQQDLKSIFNFERAMTRCCQALVSHFLSGFQNWKPWISSVLTYCRWRAYCNMCNFRNLYVLQSPEVQNKGVTFKENFYDFFLTVLSLLVLSLNDFKELQDMPS